MQKRKMNFSLAPLNKQLIRRKKQNLFGEQNENEMDSAAMKIITGKMFWSISC